MKKTNSFLLKSWWVYSIIAGVSLILVVLLLYSSNKALFLIENHSSSFNHLSKAKANISTAKFMLGKIFPEHSSAFLKQAEAHFNLADHNLEQLAEGGSDRKGEYDPKDEKFLQNNIRLLRENIRKIKLQIRHTKVQKLIGASPSQQIELEKQLSNSSLIIKDLYTVLNHISSTEAGKFESFRNLIIAILLALQLMVVFSIYIFNVKRKRDYLTIRDNYKKLQETYVDLEIAKGIIKENENKYRTLVERSPFGILELDRDGNFISINEASIKLREIPNTQEVLNTNYFEFVDSKDRARIKRIFKDTLEGSTNKFDYFSKAVNQRQKVISSSFIPLIDNGGTINKIMGVSQDITDIITYREKLEKSKLLYSILSEVNQAIVRINDKKRLYNKICRIFVEYGKFKMAWIGLIDFDKNIFSPVESFGGSKEYFKNLTFSLDDKKYIEMNVFKQLMRKNIVVFNNINDDANYPFWRETSSKAGFVSGAAIPIIKFNRVIGVLSIGSSETNYFGEDEYKLLNEISLDITYALEKIDYEHKRHFAESAIINIEKGVSSAIGKEFFDGIVTSLNKIIGASVTYVGEYHRESQTIELVSVEGSKKFARGTSYNLEGTPCQNVISKGNYFKNSDILSEFPADKLLYEMKIKGYFGIRLQDSENNIIGILVSLFENKIDDSNIIHSIYKIFSSRIAAELEREKIFDSLLTSEKRIAALIDQSPTAIALFSMDGILLKANEAWSSIWKLKLSDACGKLNVMTEVKFKKSPIYYCITKESSGKNNSHEVFEITNYEGEIKYLSPKFFPLHNAAGEKENYVIFVDDVTDLKILEKERQLSELKYENLYEQSNDAIYLLYDYKFEIINKKFTELFGLTLEEVNAEDFNFMQLVAPKSLNTIKDRINRMKAGEKLDPVYEFTAINKDGKEIDCETSVTYIDYKEGKATQGIIRDITIRNQAVKELIKARQIAEDSDRLKSEFLAQMSHEIRTPINTLLSFTSLIQNELEGKASDELKESFDTIGSAGRRIIRTVDLILNMSEIQTNSYDYRPRFINLKKKIFDKLAMEYRMYAEEKGLLFNYDDSFDEILVYADEYTLEQIFSNILDNAIKYTHNGSVEIGFFKNAYSIDVIIKDTGLGISKKYLPKLFQAFSQEEQGYTRSFEGNGLGLALVKRFCDMNDIEIKVNSKKKKGTIFTLTFKIYEP